MRVVLAQPNEGDGHVLRGKTSRAIAAAIDTHGESAGWDYLRKRSNHVGGNLSKRRKHWVFSDPLRTAQLGAKRLRDEIVAPLCGSLAATLNTLDLGKPWRAEENPSLRDEGEFLSRIFCKSAGVEIVASISGTIFGLEIAVNADRIDGSLRMYHAHQGFPLDDVEAGGVFTFEALQAAADAVILAIRLTQTKRKS
jgi:hypothetical protein